MSDLLSRMAALDTLRQAYEAAAQGDDRLAADSTASDYVLALQSELERVGFTFPGSQPVTICPECVQSKHSNCDGTAWDFSTDTGVDCGCEVCA